MQNISKIKTNLHFLVLQGCGRALVPWSPGTTMVIQLGLWDSFPSDQLVKDEFHVSTCMTGCTARPVLTVNGLSF